MRRRPRAAAIFTFLLGISTHLAVTPSMAAQFGDKNDPAAAANQPRPVATPPALKSTETVAVDSLLIMGATAMTLLMIPALGLFYGGMVRRKNVLATFQKSFILLGFVGVLWAIIGYSVAFGPDLILGLCGRGDFFLLQNVGLNPDPAVAASIPNQLFMTFQMMVAVFTIALVSGAVVERVKFSAYLIYAMLWIALVYAPVAHWLWTTDGWIKHVGGLDFGGGLVVHLTSGLAALCCALVLGKRRGLDTEDMHPHNLTLTASGTALLWFGWLGLNVGQARAAGPAAVTAFVASNLAPSAAIVSWSVLEYLQNRKVTVLGTCTAAIAGLVAISASAAYVTPLGALLIGFLIGPFCYAAILIKGRLGYDDSLDVFAVHGVGGATGSLALGFFASPELTGGAGGLIHGSTDLLVAQAIATSAVAIYTVIVTLAILVLVNRVVGLRVSHDEEDLGLDLTQHGQRGYIMGEGELIGMVPR